MIEWQTTGKMPHHALPKNKLHCINRRSWLVTLCAICHYFRIWCCSRKKKDFFTLLTTNKQGRLILVKYTISDHFNYWTFSKTSHMFCWIGTISEGIFGNFMATNSQCSNYTISCSDFIRVIETNVYWKLFICYSKFIKINLRLLEKFWNIPAVCQNGLEIRL